MSITHGSVFSTCEWDDLSLRDGAQILSSGVPIYFSKLNVIIFSLPILTECYHLMNLDISYSTIPTIKSNRLLQSRELTDLRGSVVPMFTKFRGSLRPWAHKFLPARGRRTEFFIKEICPVW